MSAFRANVAGWICQVIGTLFLLLDSVRVGIRLPPEGVMLGDPATLDRWYYQWASPLGFFLLLAGFSLSGVALWISRPRQRPPAGSQAAVTGGVPAPGDEPQRAVPEAVGRYEDSRIAPENSALEKALQENLSHARHQETQRERYMALYWLLWAAVLAYVGRQGDFASKVAENKWIFGFLSIMSLATLIINLKWNAEFANHMAAAATIADRLGLNRSAPTRDPNWPLPYPEFTGYMALPLKFPLLLNVGPWLSGTHFLGVALSVWLFVYGWTSWVLGSLLVGSAAGVAVVALSYWMYVLMRQGVQARMPRRQ